LATAIQYKANIRVIVVNNGMYGTIRMHQEREYPGRISGTPLTNPNFAELARSFGAFGAAVETARDFEKAFGEAMRFDGPAMIEVRIDPEAITPVTTITKMREQAMASNG
jgi:acetolactate synthase-1/2/3 large subunit